jgi:hypothetical protein
VNTEINAKKKHCPSNNHMQLTYWNKILPFPRESDGDHNDSETSHTFTGSQLMQTDQPTTNTDQNIRKACAQEIRPDNRRKPNIPETSVWISTTVPSHKQNDSSDNKRNVKKSKSKSKAIPVTGRESLQGCEMSSFPHFLDNRLTDGG